MTTPSTTPTPHQKENTMPNRFLVLVPQGDEWHIATRAGRLVTTTERAQIGLGRIEGKRAPLILADAVGDLAVVDILELLTDQVAPPTASADRPAAPEGPPPGPPNPPRPPKDRPVG